MRSPEIKRLAEFLREHAPHLRAWPVDRLESWIEWYWLDARVGVVTKRGKLLGVVLARALDRPEQAVHDYLHRESGRIVWIDAMVSTDKAVVHAMVKQARKRFGERDHLGGNLMKRAGRLVLFPWNRIETLSRHDHQHS